MGTNSKQKVLFVCHNHPAVRPGGAEGYALDLYRAVRERGEWDAAFLARAELDEEQRREGGVAPADPADPHQHLFHTGIGDYDWVFGRSPDKETMTRFFGEFLRSQRPDVIHFQHTLFIGYDAVRVARNACPDAAIVMTLHEYLPICHRDGQMVRTVNDELCDRDSPRRCNECFPEVSPETFLLRKRFIQSHLELVDQFFVPGENAREQYVQWGIPPERIELGPYAVRPTAPAPVEERARRDRFAFFGQLTPYKGVDVLLEAMELLGERFPGQLVLHGGNLEQQRPEFRERLSALIERAPATVTLAGPYEHDELPRLMEHVDWVVVPSIWNETGPIVVLEAFQHGRPVIATGIGGMAEKVAHEQSGLLFRRSDPESLAGAISRAASDDGLWERLRAGIPPVPTIQERARVVSERYRALVARRRAGTSSQPAAERPA